MKTQAFLLCASLALGLTFTSCAGTGGGRSAYVQAPLPKIDSLHRRNHVASGSLFGQHSTGYHASLTPSSTVYTRNGASE